MLKTYVVSLAPEGELDRVAENLQSRGATVRQKMDAIGIIEIEAAEEQLEGLRGLDGVANVEPSGEVQLPPPESPLQ